MSFKCQASAAPAWLPRWGRPGPPHARDSSKAADTPGVLCSFFARFVLLGWITCGADLNTRLQSSHMHRKTLTKSRLPPKPGRAHSNYQALQHRHDSLSVTFPNLGKAASTCLPAPHAPIKAWDCLRRAAIDGGVVHGDNPFPLPHSRGNHAHIAAQEAAFAEILPPRHQNPAKSTTRNERVPS